ncbi:MAG: flippase-like domain-containing protein [Acidobacteriota bacterium]|jgi:uncharacterized protein (TIRG00374 family)|nr:flippase-like domain-containing protein [Acidobacteriota bacterium]
MKSAIATIVKLLVTGLFFYYIFSKVDPHQFAGTLKGADLRLLAAAFLLLMLGHLICVFRWRMLMRPLMPAPSVARLGGIYCIGMFFNLTFPTIIGGDVVKVYYAGKPSKSWAESFASTFLDRDVGMFAMMVIACCAISLHPVSVPRVPVTAVLWAVFGMFILGNIAVFTPRFYRVLSALLQKAHARKLAAKTDNVAGAFQVVGKRPGVLWAAFAISLANQLMCIATTWLTGLALGVDISPLHYLIFVPVVTLISMLPISLNGMGLREYSFLSLFGAVGVAHEPCVALGLLASLMIILSSLPGGIVYILFRHKDGAEKVSDLEAEMRG